MTAAVAPYIPNAIHPEGAAISKLYLGSTRKYCASRPHRIVANSPGPRPPNNAETSTAGKNVRKGYPSKEPSRRTRTQSASKLTRIAKA